MNSISIQSSSERHNRQLKENPVVISKVVSKSSIHTIWMNSFITSLRGHTFSRSWSPSIGLPSIPWAHDPNNQSSGRPNCNGLVAFIPGRAGRMMMCNGVTQVAKWMGNLPLDETPNIWLSSALQSYTLTWTLSEAISDENLSGSNQRHFYGIAHRGGADPLSVSISDM
jgi:hypothetical protein